MQGRPSGVLLPSQAPTPWKTWWTWSARCPTRPDQQVSGTHPGRAGQDVGARKPQAGRGLRRVGRVDFEGILVAHHPPPVIASVGAISVSGMGLTTDPLER